jgi:uncharacterized protein (TIGR04255 family)
MISSDTDRGIPVRLKKEPLLEAVWEIRFRRAKPSVFELLPGLIYQAQSGKYPRSVRLPAADIPSAVTEVDASLRYLPKIRLEGDNYAVQVGEHAVSLSCRRPYAGWESFSKEIRTLVDLFRGTGLIEQLERFSLKYVDLIALNEPPDLGCLDVEVKLGRYQISTRPIHLRSELREEDLIHIIQIVSPARVVLPGGEKLAGVLLDIDTICPLEEGESWDVLENRLEGVHAASKRMFFGLLTAETLRALEPEY